MQVAREIPRYAHIPTPQIIIPQMPRDAIFPIIPNARVVPITSCFYIGGYDHNELTPDSTVTFARMGRPRLRQGKIGNECSLDASKQLSKDEVIAMIEVFNSQSDCALSYFDEGETIARDYEPLNNSGEGIRSKVFAFETVAKVIFINSLEIGRGIHAAKLTLAHELGHCLEGHTYKDALLQKDLIVSSTLNHWDRLNPPQQDDEIRDLVNTSFTGDSEAFNHAVNGVYAVYTNEVQADDIALALRQVFYDSPDGSGDIEMAEDLFSMFETLREKYSAPDMKKLTEHRCREQFDANWTVDDQTNLPAFRMKRFTALEPSFYPLLCWRVYNASRRTN